MAMNFYDILGVTRDATADEVKKAYKKAALQHHPDKGGDPEKFKECNAAVETLTDERKRMAYDSQLMRARSMDGMRRSQPSEADRQRGSSMAPRAHERAGSASHPFRPPRPPGAGGAVEIPSDPSSLSIKELKELLSNLGIDHEGCLEKADLLALLQQRKERRAEENTPRQPSRPSREKPSTPRSPQRPQQASGTAASPGPGGARALRVKVMSLGSGNVGKSTLIKRYCEGRFVQKYITTIGIDYGVKPVKVLGHDLKVNFFDTSGGDEFKDIRVEFYSMGDTSGVLLVFDVTNRATFAELEDWLAEANKHGCPISKTHKDGESPFVILCGNKTDLPRRQVKRDEAMAFAQRHGLHYYETSANSGDNVSEAMGFLFERIVGHHLDMRRKLGAG